MTTFARRAVLVFLFLLHVSATYAVEPSLPDAAEVKLRAYLAARIVCQPFVFGESKLPATTMEPATAVADHVGEHELKVMIYDRRGKAVVTADKPGPYAVIVDVMPRTGRTSRRMATIYRLASPIDGERTFNASTLTDFAKAAGIDDKAVARQATLVMATLKDRPWKEAAKDPRVARLLAGLAVDDSVREPVRKNNDAFAQERQWWVGLKHGLYDYGATAMKKPFAAPVKMEGVKAPVVHEGTLKEAGMKPDAAEKIDAALKAWAADTDQAFAVCVVRHGVIVIHKAYGMRDGQPMTVTTKSWMASVTKTMSATLMMMLVDQGLADLDDRVDKFLPQLVDKTETPLTIRHLYTHTNGLDKWPGWSDELPDLENLVADCFSRVKVGKEWAYNGLGYTLGGKVIESISGEAVTRFYLTHLLDPLGCENTDVIATHADAQSVPLDMARFGQMLLNKGSYGNLRFMRPQTFDRMMPQRLVITLGPDAQKTFGIGLDGQPGSGKFGHGAASAATFSINQKDDLVVIMTRNKIGTNYDKYNGRFWKAIEDGIERGE